MQTSLCGEIAGHFNWGFVNVNLRPYYAEGSKSMGFEIAEQLGWKLPDHVVVPMAGGSLICKIQKAFDEFTKLGLVDKHDYSVHGAQAAGCSPIVNMVHSGADWVTPIKEPKTIVKSLAIGDPADAYYAARTIRDTGGNITHTAETLGKSRAAIYRLMQKNGIRLNRND